MRIWCLLATVLVGGFCLAADAVQEAAASRPVAKWSIRKIPVQQQTDDSLNELCQRWNAFRHEPADSNGFSAVLLPFHVPAEDRERLLPYANALAFLLSFDLDWAPENYCARHAYFVFKRDRQTIARLAERYTNEEIRQLVANWNATHAVGGELRGESPDRLSGAVRIYGRRGELTSELRFDKPQPFSGLLGDMSVGVLKQIGGKPSAKLEEWLHQPRCKNIESIEMLGRMAHVEERGEEEFGTYARIVETDPGFAEVRYWYANQSYWQTNNRGAYQREKMAALRTRVFPAAFDDLDRGTMQKAELDEAARWCEQIAAIAGAESPLVLQHRITVAAKERSLTPELYKESLAACGKYPNNYGLIQHTFNIYAYQWPSAVTDSDIAVSMLLASLNSRAMPGVGHEYQAASTAYLLSRLSYPETVVNVIALYPEALDRSFGRTALIGSYFDLGQFDRAINEAETQREADEPEMMGVFYEAAASVFTGDSRRSGELRARYSRLLKKDALDDLLVAYERAAGGETIDLAKLPHVICSKDDVQRQRILCHLIVALRQNQRSPVEKLLLHSVVTMHGSRLIAYALSAYCDRYDLPIGAGLAGSWALLRPDDPLAKHLAEGPSGKRPLMRVEELQKLLAKHAPIDLVWDDVELYDTTPGPFMDRATPWMVAAICGQLMESGQHDLARELSLRYRHIMSRMERTYFQQVYANHLVYAVEQRPKKSGR